MNDIKMSSNFVSDNEWKLDRNLGSGGFGIVQLWVHVQTGKKLAIKQCKWDYNQLTPIQRKRWANEIEIMKRLSHPNIVKTGCLPFKLSYIEENLPILCMEYCKKGDLRKILNEAENCCGINEAEALKVMKEISSAVEYLHSNNITHRDLKPENIVLQDENNVVSYKLIDLGYAKELGEASTSASIVGTLNYVAPELLWKEKYSCSVDYWSLGILFYELVTGIRPFLPTMPLHTMEWMKYIHNKDYNDICAYESEGKVIFGKDIQTPTHLSVHFRKKLVEWFRVVLQWDPHKRGKVLNESGTSCLVVFTMLQHILSIKILNIFCVPFYKVYTYEIDSSITIKDIKFNIERDTNIEVKHQMLTDYYGTILIENDVPLAAQTNDQVLFVFKTGCDKKRDLIENIPLPNIPITVDKMLTQSKNQLDFEILKDYYRHTIYFVKEEVKLFQLFIFALSINIDLLDKRIQTFNTNMEKTLENAKALTNQVHMLHIASSRDSNTVDYVNKGEVLQTFFDKIDTLNSAANQIKIKFISLKTEKDSLINKFQGINHTMDISTIYNNICDVYTEFKRKSSYETVRMNMMKLVFKFLRIRTELNNENIIDVIRHIDKLQDELLTLEKIFDSVTIMTKLYRTEYEKIAQPGANVVLEQPNNQQSVNVLITESDEMTEVQAGDRVIYENLVTRYTLDNLIAEMQKNYLEVITFDP